MQQKKIHLKNNVNLFDCELMSITCPSASAVP